VGQRLNSFLLSHIKRIAPIVAVMIDPIQEEEPVSNPKRPNNHPPKNQPTIPNSIFHTTPSDFDFMILPANHPAAAPIISETISLIIVLFLSNLGIFIHSPSTIDFIE